MSAGRCLELNSRLNGSLRFLDWSLNIGECSKTRQPDWDKRNCLYPGLQARNSLRQLPIFRHRRQSARGLSVHAERSSSVPGGGSTFSSADPHRPRGRSPWPHDCRLGALGVNTSSGRIPDPNRFFGDAIYLSGRQTQLSLTEVKWG